MTAAARFMGWFSGVGKVASEVLPVRLGGQRFPGKLATPVRMAGLDWALVWVTVALLMWGLVMVYSASVAMPDNPKFSRYAHTHFSHSRCPWRPGRRWRPGYLCCHCCF